MYDTKGWWQSRTVWTGIIGLLFAILSMVGWVPEGLSQEHVAEAVMAVVGVLTIVFRIKADTVVGK